MLTIRQSFQSAYTLLLPALRVQNCEFEYQSVRYVEFCYS